MAIVGGDFSAGQPSTADVDDMRVWETPSELSWWRGMYVAEEGVGPSSLQLFVPVLQLWCWDLAIRCHI